MVVVRRASGLGPELDVTVVSQIAEIGEKRMVRLRGNPVDEADVRLQGGLADCGHGNGRFRIRSCDGRMTGSKLMVADPASRNRWLGGNVAT